MNTALFYVVTASSCVITYHTPGHPSNSKLFHVVYEATEKAHMVRFVLCDCLTCYFLNKKVGFTVKKKKKNAGNLYGNLLELAAVYCKIYSKWMQNIFAVKYRNILI